MVSNGQREASLRFLEHVCIPQRRSVIMALRKTARHSLFAYRRRCGAMFRPRVEQLEARLAPAAFVVNTTVDTVAVDLTTGKDVNGNVSLRSAVMAANNTAAADTIVLSKTTYILDQQDNFWYGPNGLPAIASDITIEGNGAVVARDSAAANF